MHPAFSFLRIFAVAITLCGWLIVSGPAAAEDAPPDASSGVSVETTEPDETEETTETSEQEEQESDETETEAPVAETADVLITVLRCPGTVDVTGYSVDDFAANCVSPEAGFTVMIQALSGDEFGSAGEFSATTDGSGSAYFSGVSLGDYLVLDGGTAFFLDQASRDIFAVSGSGTTVVQMYLATIVAGGESPAPVEEPESGAPAPVSTDSEPDAPEYVVDALPNTGAGVAAAGFGSSLDWGGLMAALVAIGAGITLRRRSL